MVSDFSKDKVFWTKSMNIELAKYMADKPQIWDTKHPQFSNIGLRDETFANFASKYDLNWQAVKDRWTNIRSTYGFYMRKLLAKKAKGETFKVNWFMWQHCKYLYKVHKFVNKTGKPSAAAKNSNVSNRQESSSDESEGNDREETTVSCADVATNIATVFRGVQNDAFGVESSEHADVAQAVTKTLSKLNSYDAAQLSQKILAILAQYDENNPTNPNNNSK